MSERENDPKVFGAPMFVFTRHRAALLVLLGYAAMAVCAKLFLSYLESTQGYDDGRDDQAAMIFAVVMAVLCVKALVNIYRPAKSLA